MTDETMTGSPSGLAHEQVLRIVLALVLAMFLAAIDQTIVSVALLSIGRDLKGFALTPWVVAGYLVAATVATPIYGKLSDAWGRRPLLLFAIGAHVLTSVLCAFAQSMPQLIAFRILQGLGGGGLLSLAQAVVADVAPGPERGRYQGYLAGTFATAAVAGPVLGGYLTFYISWRAVFWLNVPLGILAFVVVHRALRSIAFERRSHQIDYLGAALLAGSISSLMVALTLLGQGRTLLSGTMIGLILLGAALLALLMRQEQRAKEPLLPPEIFRNRVAFTCCLVLALQFFVMVGCTVLLPLAMQSLSRADADAVALRMLPLTLAIPLGAFTAGRVLYLTGRYRSSMLAGTALAAVGGLGLSWLGTEAVWSTAALMSILGVGLGLTMPPGLVAAQMAVPHRLLGVITSTTALFRTLGGAVGIAVLTSILFAQLGAAGSVPDGPPPAVESAASATTAEASPAMASRASILHALTQASPTLLRNAFELVFGAASLVALMALLLALTLPARRLSDASAPQATP